MEDPKYKFICGQVQDNLEKSIQKMLDDGWKLHGSIFTYITTNGSTVSAQAMVKGDVYSHINVNATVKGGKK